MTYFIHDFTSFHAADAWGSNAIRVEATYYEVLRQNQ